jgi:hypothetical protein
MPQSNEAGGKFAVLKHATRVEVFLETVKEPIRIIISFWQASHAAAFICLFVPLMRALPNAAIAGGLQLFQQPLCVLR